MNGMAVSFTFPGLHCSRMNCYVSLDQHEAACQTSHGCGENGRCPLKDQLGHSSLERTIARLAEEAWKDNLSVS
jgi:hypothetical protein